MYHYEVNWFPINLVSLSNFFQPLGMFYRVLFVIATVRGNRNDLAVSATAASAIIGHHLETLRGESCLFQFSDMVGIFV